MDFHWSLSDSKSPQVSRTLLSILTDLNNVVILMVYIYPLISKSFNPISKPLVIVPSTPITTGITFIFMFHSYFSTLTRSRNVSLVSISLFLPCCPSKRQNPFLFYSFFYWLLLGMVGWPRLLLLLLLLLLLFIRVFHISVSWWFFTGVWVTASLLKPPGLFSVFWPFSIM